VKTQGESPNKGGGKRRYTGGGMTSKQTKQGAPNKLDDDFQSLRIR